MAKEQGGFIGTAALAAGLAGDDRASPLSSPQSWQGAGDGRPPAPLPAPIFPAGRRAMEVLAQAARGHPAGPALILARACAIPKLC